MIFFFFFFQAEDGIRDRNVTGVQTCALPIYDVIAFTTHLSEIVGPEARFVHQGMTSSDVLDTCLNVQLMRAADLLIADVDALLAALKTRAFEYKMTPTIGRSHGIHAEPTTFGVKLATYYAEFTRARARLVAARAEIATCAISGAVGTFANIDPRVEEHVAEKMGLAVEPVSTQVIPRDPHATITLDFALARMTGVIEKLVVYPARMQENLDKTHGLVHSQRVLLALTQAGVAREDAYRLVQRNAMRAWNGEGNLLDLLKADPDVSKALPVPQLEAMFDLGYHLKQVDTIFRRVFGS